MFHNETAMSSFHGNSAFLKPSQIAVCDWPTHGPVVLRAALSDGLPLSGNFG
ncbi:hypothetical protein RISK_001731 [Rhodopirellula islandica]|uniref:Uncharacterized protein n=1 Tax=Rhodopirellula islandica TaxID=595434 RepID=A0A0J1BJ10_RHOIS|nr:hypothetical protein RISK_001731 [Rhodopirellula islandica]